MKGSSTTVPPTSRLNGGVGESAHGLQREALSAANRFSGESEESPRVWRRSVELRAGDIIATRIEHSPTNAGLQGPFGANGSPGERVQAEGIITRSGSPTDFELNGQPSTIDAGTAFVNGTIEELEADARVTIDGELTAADRRLLSHRITFGRVVDPIATVAYDFRGLSRVAVFAVTTDPRSTVTRLGETRP